MRYELARTRSVPDYRRREAAGDRWERYHLRRDRARDGEARSSRALQRRCQGPDRIKALGHYGSQRPDAARSQCSGQRWQPRNWADPALRGLACKRGRQAMTNLAYFMIVEFSRG